MFREVGVRQIEREEGRKVKGGSDRHREAVRQVEGEV